MRDVEEAKRQCGRFIAELENNRPNCDDAGVARRILEDLSQRGEPTRAHRARLTRWCHTHGTVYQRGVPIARLICVALYGEVLPRED